MNELDEQKRKFNLGEEAACPNCKGIMRLVALDTDNRDKINAWLCRDCKAVCREHPTKNMDGTTEIEGYLGGEE